MSDGYAIFDTGNDQRKPVRLLLGHASRLEIIHGLRAAGLRSKDDVLTFLMKTTGRPITSLTQLYDIESARILTELRRLARRTTSSI